MYCTCSVKQTTVTVAFIMEEVGLNNRGEIVGLLWIVSVRIVSTHGFKRLLREKFYKEDLHVFVCGTLDQQLI